MPRSSYVWRDGKLVDKRFAAPLVVALPRAPGVFAPGLIRDSMEPIPHPCTGVLMDSKAAFRAVTRAHGCEEIGSESPAIRPDLGAERAYSDELKRDIHTAMQSSDHTPAASAEAVFGAMGATVPDTADGWA